MTAADMEVTSGTEAKGPKSGNNAKSKDRNAPTTSDDAGKTHKKRRKVNHACLYCRRSHMTCDLSRPCARCVKRNISHLCHDEPRESDSRKSKSTTASSVADNRSQSGRGTGAAGQAPGLMMPPPLPSFTPAIAGGSSETSKPPFDTVALGPGTPVALVPPSPASSMEDPPPHPYSWLPESWLTNPFHGMTNFHHENYMMAPEINHEFELLHEFYKASVYETDGQTQSAVQATAAPGPGGSSASLRPSAGEGGSAVVPTGEQDNAISRPPSTAPADKTREYYLQAADPQGNAAPEQRITDLLQAKADAGLLKPFNYVAGYKRLSEYLEAHVAPASRQKISKQLQMIRAKLRGKLETLTDIDLILVEMWFERMLMDIDRVFASMAVAACCWRRTGEIFRGNKEMAELIQVPLEKLRGGKMFLHQILTEESNVRYWEEFGTIAFDQVHETLLTACSLKSPDDKPDNPVINCCFSLKIRRDAHKIPSLIVGNFIPHDP